MGNQVKRFGIVDNDVVLFEDWDKDGQLAEISVRLADLHAWMAAVLETQVDHWTPNLPVQVSRAVYDRLSGPVNLYNGTGWQRPTWVRCPQPGLTVYCIQPPPAGETV